MTPISPLTQQSHRRPVVLMSTGCQERSGHDYQVMTHKYMRPIMEQAQCLPLLVPTCFGPSGIAQYIDMADGIYLTGSATNIDPLHYAQKNETPEKMLDRARDEFDFALILAALEAGLPLLAVCRGMQALNVVLRGDLHQQLYRLPNMLDHRENPSASVEEQYAGSHAVCTVPGTWFAQLMQAEQFEVNSLHAQGIARLGKGLEVLAQASDGVIEAMYLPTHPAFNLAVQWHPEWRAASNPYSIRIFEAFGNACQQYAKKKESQ